MMPAHCFFRPRSCLLQPFAGVLAAVVAVIGTLGISPVAAHAENFLLCDQRPRTLESVVATSPLLTRVAGEQLTLHALLSRAPVGCSAQPSLLLAAQTEQEVAEEAPLIVRATYEQLIANSPELVPYKVGAFSIKDDPRPNAFVRHSSEVVLTTGLLAELRAPADLAFVLAHEVAHIQLDHSHSGTLGHEVAADDYALTLIQQAGFSPCGVPELVSRILAAGGRPESISRPRAHSLSERISSICSNA